MTVRKEGCQGKEAEEDVESCFYASLLDSLCLSRDVLAGYSLRNPGSSISVTS